jgi:hypothetical protein
MDELFVSGNKKLDKRLNTGGTMYRLVVTQAVRVEGSTDNCEQKNTGMAAS